MWVLACDTASGVDVLKEHIPEALVSTLSLERQYRSDDGEDEVWLPKEGPPGVAFLWYHGSNYFGPQSKLALIVTRERLTDPATKRFLEGALNACPPSEAREEALAAVVRDSAGPVRDVLLGIATHFHGTFDDVEIDVVSEPEDPWLKGQTFAGMKGPHVKLECWDRA